MWTIFTYAYNSILIIFIAVHLLVGAILSFLFGLYLGVFITQNYQIPRITEPAKIWDKFISFMEQRRLGQDFLLKPKTIMSIIKADPEDTDFKKSNLLLSNATRSAADADSPEELYAGGRGTPTLILTEAVGEEDRGGVTLHRSNSQILAASLIISTDENSKKFN